MESLAYLRPERVPERWNVWVIAVGFGIQSAVTFPLMNGPTMMVTIHMRKIFYTTLGWLLREKDAHLERIRIPATIVVNLLIGAVAGTMASVWVPEPRSAFLLTPTTLLQAVLLIQIDRATCDPANPDGVEFRKTFSKLSCAEMGDTVALAILASESEAPWGELRSTLSSPSLIARLSKTRFGSRLRFGSDGSEQNVSAMASRTV